MYKIILLVLILQLHCIYDGEIECDYNYRIEENENIKTFEDCFEWVKNNIVWKKDIKNYLQTPEETYQLKTGDCEDLSLLTAYWLYVKLNIDSELVEVKFIPFNEYHIILKVNGCYYESYDYNNIDDKIGKTHILTGNHLKYCEGVWEAQKRHYLYNY